LNHRKQNKGIFYIPQFSSKELNNNSGIKETSEQEISDMLRMSRSTAINTEILKESSEENHRPL